MTERELEHSAEVAKIGDMIYVRERLPGTDGRFGEWCIRAGSSLVECSPDERKLVEVLLTERKAAADKVAALISAVNKAMDERLAYIQRQVESAESIIASTTRYAATHGSSAAVRTRLDDYMHDYTVALSLQSGARAMKNDLLIDLAKITGTEV